MYRRVAYAIAALTGLVLAVGGVGLAAFDSPAFDTVAYYAAGVALGVPAAALGLVVAARRPENPVGALLTFTGFAIAFITSLDTYTLAATVHPDRLPLPAVMIPLSQGLWMLWYLPIALLVLYVPDGRLPGRRWRWVVGGLVVDFAAFVVVAGMAPGAYSSPYEDAPRAMGTLPDAALPVIIAMPLLYMGLLIAATTAMVRKYRAADEKVRKQLKWFAVAGFWLPITLLLCWVSYLLLDSSDLVVIGLFGLFVTVPVATAIALLRYDLYDVDKAISTAITYAAVTAALLGIYTVAVFLGGLLIGGESAIAAAAAAAICAAALTPVKRRLQRFVDRRLYPLRQSALDAIEELRRRTDTGQAQPEELEIVLRKALRDPGLRVAYRPPGSTEAVDARGEAIQDAEGTPIVLGGQEIGVLLKGSVGSPQLLKEVAAASALLVEVARLRIELASALREVESSRSRLLATGYRERRRLERDLHDGAQQRLVTLGMAIRLAQRHLGDGTVDVDGLLDQSVAELGTAVAELRAIAHGLRPSSLDDGLDVAVRTLAGSLSVPVTLELESGLVADEVATTAYYVVSEAVTNAVKHAEAGWIGLSVTKEEANLNVKISDDGRGGAILRPGSGLAGLADRVAAAGGALLVESPSGRGTTIRAVLPCVS